MNVQPLKKSQENKYNSLLKKLSSKAKTLWLDSNEAKSPERLQLLQHFYNKWMEGAFAPIGIPYITPELEKRIKEFNEYEALASSLSAYKV